MPLIEYEYVFSCSHSYSINAVGCLKPPLEPSLPRLIRVRLICRGFLFDFVLCVLFFVCCLDFRSFLACVFIFHFSFSFSISIFIQFILMPFKAARALVEWLQNEVGGCGCSWGGITPFGIPGLQTLFSRELT